MSLSDSPAEHPLAPALSEGLAALGLPLTDGQQGQLLAYLDLIARWSQVYNLTAIREPQPMLTQHLLDCLTIVPPLRREAAALRAAAAPAESASAAPAVPAPLRLLDVGSGAGLPGVVIAICQPDWQVTCVDTVAKKAGFIRQVAAELGLRQLTATHQRVEAMREPAFDIVTSRAFASLKDFVTLSAERLAPAGRWAAMKARLSDAERAELSDNVHLLSVEPLQVPGLDAERCIVWMAPAATTTRAT